MKLHAKSIFKIFQIFNVNFNAFFRKCYSDFFFDELTIKKDGYFPFPEQEQKRLSSSWCVYLGSAVRRTCSNQATKAKGANFHFLPSLLRWKI